MCWYMVAIKILRSKPNNCIGQFQKQTYTYTYKFIIVLHLAYVPPHTYKQFAEFESIRLCRK